MLGPNQLAVIASADSAELRKQFRKVVLQWPKNRWLGTSNRYAVNTIKKLEADVQAGASVHHSQLSLYIAASVVVHCTDGWSYVARAVEAALSGDTHAATHLAYYAELRAAMSILAAAGIGVFDKRHYVIASDKKCHLVNGRTHAFAWEALAHWANQPGASKLVLEVIQPGGVSLEGWLKHFPAATGAVLRGKVVSNWLLDWGLDLKVFVEDRDARNSASYRPTSLPITGRPDFMQTLEFLEGFWSSFEPTALNDFRILDRFLLRRSLVQAFTATNDVSPRQAPRAYMRFIDIVLHAVAPGDMRVEDWRAFLDVTKGTQSELPIIEAAARRMKPSSPIYHSEVVARAALLLRVATGASRALLEMLPTGERSDLTFWWQVLGEDRGFWQMGSVPSNLADLWTDVDIAIAQSRGWRATRGSRQAFLAAHARSARTLSECERIPLWGLGL